jgi:hypothetical protein
MSTISLRLPHSLHQQTRQLADQGNVSINQRILILNQPFLAAALLFFAAVTQ